MILVTWLDEDFHSVNTRIKRSMVAVESRSASDQNIFIQPTFDHITTEAPINTSRYVQSINLIVSVVAMISCSCRFGQHVIARAAEQVFQIRWTVQLQGAVGVRILNHVRIEGKK